VRWGGVGGVGVGWVQLELLHAVCRGPGGPLAIAARHHARWASYAARGRRKEGPTGACILNEHIQHKASSVSLPFELNRSINPCRAPAAGQLRDQGGQGGQDMLSVRHRELVPEGGPLKVEFALLCAFSLSLPPHHGSHPCAAESRPAAHHHPHQQVC